MARTWKALTVAATLLACGCTVKVEDSPGRSGTAAGGTLGGEVVVDGSSTVLPISKAVAEEFVAKHPDVNVTVTGSGTSSGFKRFIAGEIDIADASRPIKESEKQQLSEKGIDYVELQVAIDGLSVAVSQDNDWCQALTVKQLGDLWKSGSSIRSWSQLDPSWPDAPIKLYGAGANSGTFDYFTEVICGRQGDTREDYNQSENDNELVIGIAGDKHALGYFGYSYFDENRQRLKAVRIAPGDDVNQAVEPTAETIQSGAYTPLSRPIFIYVSKESLKRPEVRAYVEQYLSDEGQVLVEEAHCIRMSSEQLAQSRKTLEEALAAAGG